MLEYFQNIYWPNLMFCNAVACGATVGDVHDAAAHARDVLKQGADARGPAFKDAIFQGFTHVADRLEGLSAADAAQGRFISAGEKRLRAAAILLALEMMLTDFHDPVKIGVFKRFRQNFIKGIALAGYPHDHAELVQIPYQGKSLDGVFVKPLTSSPVTPVVVQLNGGHSTMEWPYLTGMTNAMARRGIASLIFDHPGSGTARYEKGLMFRHDSEVYAAAAVDYLASRPDVDPERIGVCGASLGGYFAPRAAAREKRFKICIAWSALYQVTPVRYFGEYPPEGPFDPGMTFKLKQLCWQFGVETTEELYEVVRRYTLDEAIEELTVPILVVHGRNDSQTPLYNAVRTINAAVNSPGAELVIIEPDQGGDQHCNLDNPPTALGVMADWAARKLGGRTSAA